MNTCEKQGEGGPSWNLPIIISTGAATIAPLEIRTYRNTGERVYLPVLCARRPARPGRGAFVAIEFVDCVYVSRSRDVIHGAVR